MALGDLNALAPIADVNSVLGFVNNQIANGNAAIAPETFYSKQLLDTIRMDADQYVYFRLADAMPIQEKADKLMVRRWAPLQAHIVPLSEGIPPISDKGSVEKYEMQAFQYGRFMEFSDKVNFKVVDPVVAHYSKEYSLVAMETLDMLARETLLMVAQKHYAGGVLNTDGLTFANGTPSMTDLRKIVLGMKKALIKPRTNGRYHVIGSPEFYYDMLADQTVKDYMTINLSTKTMFDGGVAPLVPMFGLEFYETLLVPTSGEYVDAGGNRRLKIWSGTVAAPTIGTSATTDLNEVTAGHLTTANGYVKDSRTGSDASYIPNQETWHIPEGSKEFKMQHILVVGKDALQRTGLAGEDSAKMYVKPLGSTGVLDPIDQRQSIGFKINSVGFASVAIEAVVDYICVPTQVNL